MKFFSLTTVLALLIGCQTAQPVTDLKTPYRIKGFSFLPPQGPNWYPNEKADRGAVQIYFFKKDEAFENDIKQTIAGEVFVLFLAPQTKDDKAVLQEFADSVVQMDQKVPDRHVIISEKSQFVTQGNMLILKKSRIAEDRKVPRWPDEVFYMKKSEVFALNKAKRAIIMMNYSQRYPKTAQPRDLAQELEPYLQSLSLYDEAP